MVEWVMKCQLAAVTVLGDDGCDAGCCDDIKGRLVGTLVNGRSTRIFSLLVAQGRIMW